MGTLSTSRRMWLALLFCILFVALINFGLFYRHHTIQNTLGVTASKMLRALDTIKSNTKGISIIELNAQGESTLYEYVRFQNPSNKPITELPGVGSFATIPYFSVGGEPAKVEFGEYLPNKIERHFTAKLQHPIPPAGWCEIIMVGERIAKYKATKLKDGSWQFGPITPETSDPLAIILAIKLPPGAYVTTVNPKPDEIRQDAAAIIVWHRTLSADQDVKLSVRYRLRQ